MSDGIESIGDALVRLGAGVDERVRLGDLLAGLGAKGYGLVMLMLALPNLTPGPSLPGFSTIFGLPLCLIAAQMALGREHMWMPRRLAGVQVSRARLVRVIGHALPSIRRVEALLRPRWSALIGPDWAQLAGLVCLVMAMLLALPIPIFSMMPAAAVALVALGLLAHDGAAVALGLAASLGTVVAFALLAWAALDWFVMP
jgi:hypothetical protein